VLPPGDRGNAATGGTSYGAYATGGVLPIKTYRTGRTIKAECCHRGNIIGGSHRVLPPGEAIGGSY